MSVSQLWLLGGSLQACLPSSTLREICFSFCLLLTEISALKESRAVHFREATRYRVNYRREGNRGRLASLQAIYSKTRPGDWNQAREAPSNKRRRSEEGQEDCQLSPLLLDRREARVVERRAAESSSHHYDAVQFPIRLFLPTSHSGNCRDRGSWLLGLNIIGLGYGCVQSFPQLQEIYLKATALWRHNQELCKRIFY